MYKAVFLDRDGVLNVDVGFLHRIDDLVFYSGVIDGLMELSQTEYKIVIITNQPGIGRGYYTESEYLKFEQEYLSELFDLSNGKIRIDKIYHCPHHPTEGLGAYKKYCTCRKPQPGMLIAASKDLNINLANSVMVGDKRSDIAAGVAAGCKTVLVQTGYAGIGGIFNEHIIPSFIAPDFMSVKNIIMKLQ